jgi:hypothetical protein
MTSYFHDYRLDSANFKITRQNGNEQLKIPFRRTICVPDNAGRSQLPPDIGAFPLYKVNDYAKSLSENMVAKAGVFIPMYHK